MMRREISEERVMEMDVQERRTFKGNPKQWWMLCRKDDFRKTRLPGMGKSTFVADAVHSMHRDMGHSC